MSIKSFGVIAVAVLAACAGVGGGTFTPTYLPPVGPSVQLIAIAAEKTETPILVDVCMKGRWETAAVLGSGLWKVGSIVYSERHNPSANPNAVKLPDRADFPVAANQKVKLRIGSHWVATGSNVATSCAVTVAFDTEEKHTYTAAWRSLPKACELGVTKKIIGGGVETVLTNIATDASC